MGKTTALSFWHHESKKEIKKQMRVEEEEMKAILVHATLIKRKRESERSPQKRWL